jgi:uncharacterized membrane protein YidH (DUF202 family)
MTRKVYKGSGADFITAVCLVLFGAAFSIAALRMRVFNNSLLVSPGLFPLILGVVFILLGLLLLRSAAKRGGWEQASHVLGRENLHAFATSPRVRKAVVLLLLIIAYVAAVANFPFLWATVGYLLVTFIYLKAMKLPWILLVSFLAAYAITFAFRDLFQIPMP